MSRFSIKKLHNRLRACQNPDHFVTLAMNWEPRCQNAVEWDTFCTNIVATLEDRFHSYDAAGKIFFTGNLDQFTLRRKNVESALRILFLSTFTCDPVIATTAVTDFACATAADKDLAALRLLIWAGYDVNAPLDTGHTALHFSAFISKEPWANPRAVRVLLDAGADPNARGGNGHTPLFCTCDRMTWNKEATQTATMLLDAGADPSIESAEQMLAISMLYHWEAKSPHEERRQLIGRLQQMMRAPIEEACTKSEIAQSESISALPTAGTTRIKSQTLRM